MRHTHLLVMLSVLGFVPMLSAEEKPQLPSLRELDRFIQECRSILAQRQPTNRQPTGQKPPRTSKVDKMTSTQRMEAAQKVAHELAFGTGDFNKKKQTEILEQLKSYKVPGVMGILHPLLVGHRRQGQQRVAFQLGQHFLPKIFNQNKGTDKKSSRIAFHSPAHLAFREWMSNAIRRHHKLTENAYQQRVKKAILLVGKLKSTGEKPKAEELSRKLKELGEEWLVGHMPQIIKTNTYPDYTRRIGPGAQEQDPALRTALQILPTGHQELTPVRAGATR